MKHVTVYHSHMEIKPYVSGENINFERMLSVFNRTNFTSKPIAYYIQDETLYIPRGISQKVLKNNFNIKEITVSKEADKSEKIGFYNMLCPPKNKIQEDSISFLTSEGDFKKNRSGSQFILNIDTGDGKTYCAMSTIVKRREKAIVITHATKIKNQWIASFLNKTDVPKNRLYDIEDSKHVNDIMNDKVDADIYFVNHQTIQAYARSHGWLSIRELFKKLEVGIKVVDEAHKYLENILRLDMFTNCKYSIYLTATFKRTDAIEDIIFKKSFSSAYKFGMETRTYEGKRKHIVYIPVLFRSRPTPNDLAGMRNAYGFSANKYTEYALENDPQDMLVRVIEYVVKRINKMEGKTLVTCSKIEGIEYLKKYIDNLELGKDVATIHSKHSEKENEENKKADIIISTTSGAGTGFDVVGMRSVINTEPFSSQVTFEQLKGRLREYGETEDTYLFDLIDLSIPKCEEFYKIKMRYAKNICKQILIDDTTFKEI